MGALSIEVGVEGIEPSRGGSKDRCLTPWLYSRIVCAGKEGIEPPLLGLESSVLPLHNSPK
jgi:hypothetical protein